MNEADPRFWQMFLEVFEALPRQGPGNRASAMRALAMCSELPSPTMTLDLGCGTGCQTLYLAELTSGSILAVDNLPQNITRLVQKLSERDLSERVRPMLADMGALDLPPDSFDLIWSEGALYNIGIPSALGICAGLLRPGGYLVFTEAVWRTEDPPPEIQALFDADYPEMGRVPDVLATIGRSGLSLVGHFTLPDEAWWEDFYRPMEARVASLRAHYAADAQALEVLDKVAREPELHRRYAHTYAYEFFVVKKASSTQDFTLAPPTI